MSGSTATITQIKEAILRYLEQHPLASDNLGGIENWWLADAMPPARTPDIQRALDMLVEEGRLQRSRLVDGSDIYLAAPTPLGSITPKP